jgi:hypothetical protein
MRPLTRAFAATYLPLIAGLELVARPAGRAEPSCCVSAER